MENNKLDPSRLPVALIPENADGARFGISQQFGQGKNYVDTRSHFFSQVSSSLDIIWLTCHADSLAGRFIYSLNKGDELQLEFENKDFSQFVVKEIQFFQNIIEDNSTHFLEVDEMGNPEYTLLIPEDKLHRSILKNPTIHLVIQVAMKRNGDEHWGRCYVIFNS